MNSHEFTYKYRDNSHLSLTNNSANLSLACFNPIHEPRRYLEARVIYPEALAKNLSILQKIIHTHFFKPMPAQLDPVLTVNNKTLRFEGFSTCCGVYARFDAPIQSFDVSHLKQGTTNVDFNVAMQQSIAMLTSKSKAHLSIAEDEFSLQHDNSLVVEKRVSLPQRWLKGFGEVQNLQSLLHKTLSVPTLEALKTFRALPKGRGPVKPVYFAIRGKSLQVSQAKKEKAIAVTGINRLKVLEPLLQHRGVLHAWTNNELGVSAWMVSNEYGCFTLVISPDLYRGFSGEGQLLGSLAKPKSIDDELRAQLHWQDQLNVQRLQALVESSCGDVSDALKRISAEGLLGFDIGLQSYFHRELPFNRETMLQLQPRLKNAHKLVTCNAVKPSPNSNSDFIVSNNATNYLVRLEGESVSCTCPWYGKYKTRRGECKHILAAQLFKEEMHAN